MFVKSWVFKKFKDNLTGKNIEYSSPHKKYGGGTPVLTSGNI